MHSPSGCSDAPYFLVSPASWTISAFVSSDLRPEAGRPLAAMWPLLLFPTQKSCLFLPGSSSLWGLETSVHSALPPAVLPLGGAFPFPDVVGQEVLVFGGPPGRATEGGSWVPGKVRAASQR